MKWHELSKAVGWDERKVTYPTEQQLKDANPLQILEWHRFLPSPKDNHESEIINEISIRLSEIRMGDGI